MKYSTKNPPLVCMMTQNVCYKNTGTMQVKGICWHDTAANNTAIKRYVQPSDNDPKKAELLKILGVNAYHNDWNHTNRQAGVNAFVGKLADGTVTTCQTMPWNYRPWGVGPGAKGSINTGWIQFEICEDAKTDSKYFGQIFEEACQLTAYLCKMFNIDPNGYTMYNGVKVPNICCHGDATKLKVGYSHSDIYDWFPNFGSKYKTMQPARDRVTQILSGVTPTPTPKRPEDTKMRTIKKGSKGDAVKLWQQIMVINGIDIGKWGIDGDFGSATQTATNKFKKQVGLTQNGTVDDATWTKGLESVK